MLGWAGREILQHHWPFSAPPEYFPFSVQLQKVGFLFFYILVFNEVSFPDKRFVFSPASLPSIPPPF